MPESISVLEAIPVLEMPSSVFREVVATKTTPAKPTEMTTAETATITKMATATGEMAATKMGTATEMATATTEASTMTAPSSAMASAVGECGGGHNRQNTGQNQTGKETVKKSHKKLSGGSSS